MEYNIRYFVLNYIAINISKITNFSFIININCKRIYKASLAWYNFS